MTQKGNKAVMPYLGRSRSSASGSVLTHPNHHPPTLAQLSPNMLSQLSVLFPTGSLVDKGFQRPEQLFGPAPRRKSRGAGQNMSEADRERNAEIERCMRAT